MARFRRFRMFRSSLGAVAVLAIVVLLGTIALDSVQSMESPWRPAWAITSLAMAGLLAFALAGELANRARSEKTLFDAAAALNELSGFDTAGDERSSTEMLDDLTARVRSVLEAAWSVVWLTDTETSDLRLASSSGDSPWVLGEPLDGAAVPRDTLPDRLAVPLALRGDQLGLLEIGARSGTAFDRRDHHVLRAMADRIAVAIERSRLADAERRLRLGASQARAHLALIAEASKALARTLEDTQPAHQAVTEIVVREFADMCAIHLARPDGSLERVAVGWRHPTAEVVTDPHVSPDDEGDALRRVMASGVSELSFVTGNGHVYGGGDDMAARMQASGMTSWVVAPIRLRGLPLGAIVVATGSQRRGYRPSDQAVVDELAARLATVIERAMLYRETRMAAVDAEQRAGQLSNLIEAAIAFNRSLLADELLQALVTQASRVLAASHCRAWLDGDAGLEAEQGRPQHSGTRIGSPLVNPGGDGIGYLTVERDEDQPFSSADEALLLLLARFASVAFQNANLYDGVLLREQRLEALIAASPLAILELDRAGEVQDANPAARVLFATEAGDIKLPDLLTERLVELRASALQGRVSDGEVSTETDNGRLELWVSTAPLRRGTGAPLGVLAVVTDMTERKRLEEQLIEAHRYEAIAQLAGGIAHDFNNLLTIIVGYSDMLLRSMTPESQEHSELAAIHEAGRHAAVITNQLLTLSRRQVVQPVVVEMASSCQSLRSMLQRLVGGRVSIETRCKVEGAIRIDPGQFEQVLFNLVLNSRDASPDGSAIVIETQELSGHGGRDEVAVVVSDPGQGMDAETIARCREPFFTTKGRRGIGLGLATVVSIVQRAGGRLEIDSEVGRGTTISAVFPRAVATAAAASPVRRGEQARVLLVDDDDLIRRYAAQVLQAVGYAVTVVGDAEVAVSTLSDDAAFDLLISDVVLPGMNGFELARRVGDKWPGIARLLITGYAGTDTGGTGLEAVAVLPKPFAGEDLVRAAGDALQGLGQ